MHGLDVGNRVATACRDGRRAIQTYVEVERGDASIGSHAKRRKEDSEEEAVHIELEVVLKEVRDGQGECRRGGNASTLFLSLNRP